MPQLFDVRKKKKDDATFGRAPPTPTTPARTPHRPGVGICLFRGKKEEQTILPGIIFLLESFFITNYD
jgi:hypothetical protein